MLSHPCFFGEGTENIYPSLPLCNSPKASPVQGEVARHSRDGGVVTLNQINNPPPASREPPLHKGAFF